MAKERHEEVAGQGAKKHYGHYKCISFARRQQENVIHVFSLPSDPEIHPLSKQTHGTDSGLNHQAMDFRHLSGG